MEDKNRTGEIAIGASGIDYNTKIEERIFTIRGKQVMIDKDLALLYGVETKRLNEQVKRNIERFPEDFMFQLTMEECLRSRPKRVGFLRSIGRHRVVGRLRQSSASLHPPFGTSFLREPLTRPRPATLWQSLPTTTLRASMLVFQEQVPYFEPVSALTWPYKQHTS